MNWRARPARGSWWPNGLRLAGVALAVTLFVGGSTAYGAANNRVVGVDVVGSGASRQVRIQTASEPTFTVFRLANPMRVVVDISGGDLSQLQGPLVFEDGLVGQVALRQFDAGGFMVGRVIVGFEQEVAYSVRADGNAVVIYTGDAPPTRVRRALPPPVAPVDRVAAERFEKARKEALQAEAQARHERDAAEKAAQKASAEQRRAQEVAHEAERLAKAARAAKEEAERLKKKAEEGLARDRSRLEEAAREAEVRRARLQEEAARVAHARAEAQKVALRAEQRQRDAEEAAASAEASHKLRVAELREEQAKAQKEKKAANQAKRLAETARKEAAAAKKEMERAKEAAESSRRQVAKRLKSLERLEAKTREEHERLAKERMRIAGERKAVIKEREAIATEREEVLRERAKIRAEREKLAKDKRRLARTNETLDSKSTELATRTKQMQAERARIEAERARIEKERKRLERAQAAKHGKESNRAAALAEERAQLERQKKALEEERERIAREKRRLATKRTEIGKEIASVDSAILEVEKSSTKAEARLKAIAKKALAKAERSARDAERNAQEAQRNAEAAAKARAQVRAETEAKERARARAESEAREKEKARAELEATKARMRALEKKHMAVENFVKERDNRPRVASASTTRSDIASMGGYTSATLTGVQAKKSDGSVLLALRGRPRYQVLRIEDPPRLVIDMSETKRGVKKYTYGTNGNFVSRVRIGEHGKTLRAVLDLKNDSAEHDVHQVDGGLLVSLHSRKGPKPPPSASLGGAAEPGPATDSDGMRRLKDIKFTGDESHARIVVAIDPQVKVEVDDRSKRAWVLRLSNARVPKSLERSLDTEAYGSVVRLVSTYQASTQPPVVKVVANLTGPATHEIRRENGAVVWHIKGKSAPPKPAVASTTAPQTAGFASQASSVSRSVAPAQQRRPVSRRRRISIKMKDADVVNVIQLLAEVSGQNIITSDRVGGKITLKLENVPWDLALDTILKTKGYDKVRQNNILRIAPAEEIQRERELALQKSKIEEESEPTLIKIIAVNYADAKEISAQLKSILTERGSVQIDARTNTLIVEEIQSNIGRVVQLTRRLDRQTPQVLIEARIVEASSNYLQQLGIQWGGTGQATAANGNPTGLGFPSDVIVSGAADDNQTPTGGTGVPSRFAVNLPAPIGTGAGGGLGFIFGSAGGSQLLNLRLTALEENGSGRIISSPRITTLDNRTARIEQGVDVPITVVSAAGANTRFVSAVLSLEVTPHVTNDGSVLMRVRVSKNEPNFAQTGAQGDPTINRRFAQTEVLVKDGDTTVIGGIYTRNTSETESSIPLLGRIPILGWLFKSRREQDTRAELLVFITPRIVNRDQSAVDTRGTMKATPREDS